MNNNDVSFYSNYSYLRPIERGSVTSHDNGFGAQELNDIVPIPPTVILRPPYVQYYIEYPTGIFRPVGQPGDIFAGNDTDNMYFNGFVNDIPFDAVFKAYYVIYDRIPL